MATYQIQNPTKRDKANLKKAADKIVKSTKKEIVGYFRSDAAADTFWENCPIDGLRKLSY